MKPLRLIAFPGAPNLPIFAALEHGFFAEAGVEVSFSTTQSSVQQMQALAAGEFDLACTAFDNVVAYDEGQGAATLPEPPEFRAIMGATQVELSLVVAPEVTEAAGLRGRSLALDAVGTGFAFVAYDMLARLGLPRDAYEAVPVGATPERWASVKAGTHAGTISIEPFTSMALAAGYRVLARSTEFLPAYQGGVVAARAGWLADHAAEARGFIRGYLAGLDWTLATANRADAAALLARRMPEIRPGVMEAVMASLLDPRSGLTPLGAMLPEGIGAVLELRSRFTGLVPPLTEPARYLDLSHHDAVRAAG